MIRTVLLYAVEQFFLLGWIGKMVTIIALLYGSSWVAGGVGMTATADELGVAAGIVLSLLITALILRAVWRGTGRP